VRLSHHHTYLVVYGGSLSHALLVLVGKGHVENFTPIFESDSAIAIATGLYLVLSIGALLATSSAISGTLFPAIEH